MADTAKAMFLFVALHDHILMTSSSPVYAAVAPFSANTTWVRQSPPSIVAGTVWSSDQRNLTQNLFIEHYKKNVLYLHSKRGIWHNVAMKHGIAYNHGCSNIFV